MPTVNAAFERILQAWDYARLEANLQAGGSAIRHVRLLDARGVPILGGEAQLAQPDGGSGSTRITISCLAGATVDLAECMLEVQVADEREPVIILLRPHVSVSDPLGGRSLFGAFQELVAAHPSARVLEVGGRDRSGVSHRERLGTVQEYVGIDVLDGPGVDVVVDAHEMSSVLGRDRFDFACSYMVWEHLAMPWKAVIELNRVLVEGGYAFIVAPQTCGMHDLPWDFFRFSDSAFRALFAVETGFEVVDVVRESPMHVFPFLSRRAFTQDELTAGFFDVSVLVRKIGPTNLEWQADPGRVLGVPYPE